MPEQLLTATEITNRLRVSRSTFYRIRARLIANGMKSVSIGGSIRYVESSIDSTLLRCAREGRPLA